jgi:hypothetical protein
MQQLIDDNESKEHELISTQLEALKHILESSLNSYRAAGQWKSCLFMCDLLAKLLERDHKEEIPKASMSLIVMHFHSI